MKKIVFCFLMFLNQLSAWAQHADASAAQAMIDQQAKVILAKLNQNEALYNSDPKAFTKLVEQEVLPFMDFEMMARFVLGRNWSNTTPEKQKEFVHVFKDFLIRAYSKSWTQFAGINAEESIKFLNQPQVDAKQRTQLKLHVKNKKGKNNQVNFSLRHKDGQWKIYDVEFENISFLISYRGSFDQIIQQEGIDALILKLKEGSIKE